jgi:hypothetical protein
VSSGAFSAAQIVQAYEEGRDRHPLDRALVLLSAAAPGTRWDELAALTVGRRDARLLQLRERLFGARLRFVAACPSCGEKVEAEADTRVLRGDDPVAPDARELRVGSTTLRYRLPDSRDLAAVLRLPDDEAAAELLRRCVIQGSGEPAKELLDLLDRAIAEADAQAEIAFALSCPECAHRWEELLDPLTFLWTEIEAEAHRLLREVHALASAYGWGEAEILGLSATRRRAYLEMVGA